MKYALLLSIYFLVQFLRCAQSYIEERNFRERSKAFCRLNRECQRYQEYEYDYNKLFNISEIPGSQADGFLVRLPFYILADRDAHIIFTETQDPDWQADNAYEIIFGGWENYRTTIRRKRDDLELKFEYSNHILTSTCPLKALIEITTAGDIRIFIEHKLKAVLEARDSSPLDIQYVGFASLQHSLAQYFFGCKGEDIYTKSQLKTSCKNYESKSDVFEDFFEISSKKQKNALANDVLNTLFYIEARRGVRILLARDQRVEQFAEGYEIVIGRHVTIRKRKINSVITLTDVPGTDILQSNRHLTVIIQITKKGYIKVFAKHDHTQFKLLASAREKERPITKLNYVSFASSDNKSKINVFFECPFDYPFIDTEVSTKYTSIGHPLLDDPEFQSLSDKRNWLVSKCKYYTNPKYDYKDFVKLTDLEGSQPKGYQARIVFYAQGTRNAHVLLSPTNTPDLLKDNVYEFVIGGWTNSRVLIRRKKGEQTLSQVFVLHTMTPHTPSKIVIEVTLAGQIRLYTEQDKSEALASAYDPNVLPVNYVSFAAYDTQVDFFYDCK